MSQGIKHDQNKSPLELLDPDFLVEVAEVLGFGAVKYGKYNWKNGLLVTRVVGAALRHLFAFLRGETYDQESGKTHLAHATCCLMFIHWYLHNRPDLDDRQGKSIMSPITTEDDY
jgi:hypothetical protein